MAVHHKDDQILPQSFLFGQATQYAELCVKGRFRNLGVSFQPTALKTVFGIDAAALTQQHIDINDLIATNLSDQLLNTINIDEQVLILEHFFLAQTAKSQEENHKVRLAIIQLQKGKELKCIHTDLKISERSLERLFKTHVGVSPKLYSRICRFQASLKMLKAANVASLTEIAYQENYFDQSHFIRDFKCFAGTTPKSFLSGITEQFPDFPEWKP